MLLGSMIGAGVPESVVRESAEALPIDGYRLDIARARFGVLGAVRVEITLTADQPTRTLADIETLLGAARLPEDVRNDAARVFRRLAAAEAQVHATALEAVHFHEVGAVDAMIDIVGTVAALRWVGAEAVRFGELAPGCGAVETAHGPMPVPAPATLELLTGVPLRLGGERGEWVTPTGAALLTTLGRHAEAPSIRVEHVGIGVGSRPRRTLPNVVRALVGELDEPRATGVEAGVVAVLEAAIDDLTPEAMAHAAERLRDDGALDVTLTPTIMKKGRGGVMLQVVTRVEDAERLARTVLTETSTLGVRLRHEARRTLPRRLVVVDTAFGPVQIKETWRPPPSAGVAPGGGGAGPRAQGWLRAGLGGGQLDAAPEAADVAARARAAGVSFNAVYQAALVAYRASQGGGR
jgi:uncharacterized protein (TIGR00299 family) protein